MKVTRYRSSRLILQKKLFLKIWQNSPKTPVPEYLFYKVAGAVYNFVKKENLTQVFSCKFWDTFKGTFLKNTCGGCLLRQSQAEAYFRSSPTFMTELFSKKINSSNPLIVFKKITIIDAWQGPVIASETVARRCSVKMMFLKILQNS